MRLNLDYLRFSFHYLFMWNIERKMLVYLEGKAILFV